MRRRRRVACLFGGLALLTAAGCSPGPAATSVEAIGLGTVPTASRSEQQVRCQQVSDAFYDHHEDGGFAPSSSALPAPLVEAKLGVPDAHCAANPELGIHYQVLVWTHPIAAELLTTFERRLTASGFRQDASEAGRFEAPPGIPLDIEGHQLELQQITVATPTADDPLTEIIWI